jgi:tetratricopeptide (TPR) repeat protein
MRPSVALAILVASSIGLGTVTVLADPPKADAAKADGTKKDARKDPEGKRGISPYMEFIAKGEASFVARDLPGAISTFQEAIKLDTDKMLGFYRLGEAQLASGKPEEAEIAWQSAVGKKGTDDLHAKVLFVLADLRERQGKWQASKEAWDAYTAFLQNHAKAVGYPATAIERKKQVERRMKDEADYGVVKERIAKRQAEKEAEATENAKKDKRNR